MMNDFEKIEHLLLSKKFEELNPSEMKEVQEYFENAIDYNDMRDTLMQVKSTLAADKLLIKPSVDLKEKLLQQFEQTYPNHKSTGKTRPFYRKMAFQWSAAASVVVILTLSAVTYFNNLNNGAKSKEMAVNYEKKKVDEAPPTEEKSTMNKDLGNTTTVDEIGPVGYTNGERKEEGNFDQPTTVVTEDAEENKSSVYGNASKIENVVKENELNNNQGATNVPAQENDEYNKPLLRDNTTLDIKNNNTTIQSEESRDANFHYNDVKGKEDSKLLENTTILKTVNEKNRNTTTKDYWQGKKKDKQNNGEANKNEGQKGTDDIQLGGYMSVNQMVQSDKKDSLKTRSDSLNIDSNNLDIRRRDAKIENEKDEKDN